MYLSSEEFGRLGSWIRAEIEIDGDIAAGTRGKKARRVQEWLNLNGVGLSIDEDFGPITENGVRLFQADKGLAETGVVNDETYAALTADMHAILRPLAGDPDSYSDAVTKFAEAHLSVHPREIGGQNRGPWVRMYMKGNEGDAWPWCAGFTTFLMEQASELTETPMPIEGSFSCDSLAAQAKLSGNFVREADADPDMLADGSLFLVRRTSTDWTHVGTVKNATDALFGTIEGNTNDDGSREGYEVCARHRAYASKDFIVF